MAVNTGCLPLTPDKRQRNDHDIITSGKPWFISRVKCIAGVNDQVIARTLQREPKKNESRWMGRIEEGKVSLLPFPLPLNFPVLLSFRLSRLTRAERLATQAINHVVNMFASTHIRREKRCILSFLITE